MMEYSKIIEMKNTFSKLRRTNKSLINKFETANESLRLATEQIDKLNKNLDNSIASEKIIFRELSRANKIITIKDISINSLQLKEKELSDKIYSMYDKLDERIKLSNYYYNEWIDEHETNSKLNIVLIIMSCIIVGLVVALIGVWK